MKRVQRAPIFFPIVLMLVGLVILLNNFMLIEADIVGLWPVILILIGIGVLWRGDLAPSWEAHTFGITRGSVESASLEISSAEIDVRLKSLGRAGRLIAGQYTARSRPYLSVRNNHASLVMHRGNTWLFSLADWELGIAQDIPWGLLLTTHLGTIQADLRGLNLTKAHIATGIGDIRVTSPEQATGPLYVRSAFGDIYFTVPHSTPVLLNVQASPLCKVVISGGFQADNTGKYYVSPAYQPESPALEVILAATFGNIYLSLQNE
jgi:hypothetical protein